MTLQYCLQQNTRFDCIITYSTNQKFCPIFCANQWQNKQQKQNENMCLLLSVANVNDFMFNNYIIVVKKWINEVNSPPSHYNLPNLICNKYIPAQELFLLGQFNCLHVLNLLLAFLHSLVYHSLTREFPSVMDVVKL